MIRINLTRSRVQDTAMTAQSTTVSEGSSDQMRDGVLKVALILLFTIGLMIYESQNLASLNAEQARVQEKVSQLNEQVVSKAAEADKVKDIEVQAKELEDKLKILKLLSRLRLREVKTLDFMQSSIPEKVWLKKVTYDSDKKKVEAGHFQFTGSAVATDDLTEFVKRLEDSAYLMDVIIVKNQEVTATKTGTIRDFLFNAEVENKN